MLNKEKASPEKEDFPHWITDKYIFVLLLLFPLFTGFHGYTQITESKFVFFVACTVLWLAALTIGCLVLRMHSDFRHMEIPILLILMYFLLCCLSSVFSSFGSSVLLGSGRYDGLLTIFLCVCIFLGVSKFACPKSGYVIAASISMSLNSVIAILQLLGYNPLHLFPGDYTYYDAGVKFSSIFLGTIGNADLFCSFQCLVLPLTGAYYITSKKRHISLLPAIILGSYSIFVSGVSGGILAIGVLFITATPFIITSSERLRRALEVAVVASLALFFALFLSADKEAGHIAIIFNLSMKTAVILAAAVGILLLRLLIVKCEVGRKALRPIMTGLSIAAVLAALTVTYFWKGTSGTAYELSQTMHGNISDKFGSSRILIWKKVLELIPGHFLFGGGPGTLAQRLNLNFSRFVPETGKTLSTYVDNAHNEYLGILANTGLASLAVYLGAQLSSLINALEEARHSAFCVCLACSLFCYWVQAFFNLGLFLVSPLMWLFWGLMVSSISHAKSKAL